MKKLLSIITVSLIFSAITGYADDKFIDFSALPQTAQQFASANFKDKKVAVVKQDRSFLGAITDGYGTEIEFDSDGVWKEISAKTSAVPNPIIPEAILNYIRDNFKSSPVIQIEKKEYGYKIELATKQELKFSKQFVFLGLD